MPLFLGVSIHLYSLNFSVISLLLLSYYNNNYIITRKKIHLHPQLFDCLPLYHITRSKYQTCDTLISTGWSWPQWPQSSSCLLCHHDGHQSLLHHVHGSSQWVPCPHATHMIVSIAAHCSKAAVVDLWVNVTSNTKTSWRKSLKRKKEETFNFKMSSFFFWLKTQFVFSRLSKKCFPLS